MTTATLTAAQARYLEALRAHRAASDDGSRPQWLYAEQVARRANGRLPRTANGALRVLDALVDLDLVDYIDTHDRSRAFRRFRAAEETT